MNHLLTYGEIEIRTPYEIQTIEVVVRIGVVMKTEEEED